MLKYHLHPCILLALFSLAAQAKAEIKTSSANNSSSPKNRVVRMQDVQKERDVALVRIPLRLRQNESIVFRSPAGDVLTQTRPGEELSFTLRAKINQPNHFYFANYHVESEPLLWRQELREYGVRLNIYRVSSSNRDLEERLGEVSVQGHLIASDDKKVFNLMADVSSTFKNSSGQDILLVRAGFQPKTPDIPAIVRTETAPAKDAPR